MVDSTTSRPQLAPIRRSPIWLRVLMAFLGVPNIAIGLWAIANPEHWFDNFLGWAPQVVAAYPPFNEHLASDAGSGLLASGVVMTVAAVWPQRPVVITAAIAYLAFVLPHFLFHLINRSELLTGAENASNSFSLALSVAGAAVVLLWQRRLEHSSNPETE